MIKKGVKPQLRFAGFKEDWQRYKWSDTVDISTEMVDPNTRKYDELPHVAPGNIESFTGQLYDNIKLVKYENLISGKFHFYNGDIIYGKINPQLGKYILAKFEGLTSADAYVLNAKNGIVQQYLYAVLQTRDFFNYSISVSKRSGIPKINRDELNVYSFLAPCEEEQKQIGNMLLKLDDIITLYKRKYDKLTNIKKSMLEKMFPKKGSSVPEIRFKGFSDNWQQHKFSDLVLIERGGSPRPIDYFITTSSDGLNWVKIGDAPTQGHYITKTAEKIRPEGLSKTRQVQPGDLILSNSMSFGKPYIMGINGCIHDGWLLIRDVNKAFDLTFLCHLLSTSQMLEQYKAFAAGSTVNNLNKELVGNTIISVPKMKEQKLIGQCFEQLDTIITLHKHKLEKLKDIKKAYIEKMFI